MPVRRAASSMRLQGAITACNGVTSLPSASPKPPGSTKSRCMSIMTSAVLAGSNSNSYGSAGIDFFAIARLVARVQSRSMIRGPNCFGEVYLRPRRQSVFERDEVEGLSCGAYRPLLVHARTQVAVHGGGERIGHVGRQTRGQFVARGEPCLEQMHRVDVEPNTVVQHASVQQCVERGEIVDAPVTVLVAQVRRIPADKQSHLQQRGRP